MFSFPPHNNPEVSNILAPSDTRLKHCQVAWQTPHSHKWQRWALNPSSLTPEPRFSEGLRQGWDLNPSRPQHMSARQKLAKDRPLGTTAAEQATLSSIDHIINTQDSNCGKDCDLLPSYTRGKQLGAHQRGRAIPKLYLWSVYWENETGKGAGKAGCGLHHRLESCEPSTEGL